MSQNVLLTWTLLGLTVHEGQWVSMVGPNAAGKSTALRAMSSYLCKAGFKAKQNGHPRIACVLQNPACDEDMTVEELVALGRLPHHGWWHAGQASASDQHAISAALHDLDLAWARHRCLRTLSGGERQRAHLARVLATQAKLWLLDEPTAHLDAPHHRQLVKLLRRHTLNGGAAVTVLHELSMALMADHVLVLQRGQCLMQAHRDDARLHRAIETVFGDTLSIQRVNDLWIPVPCL